MYFWLLTPHWAQGMLLLAWCHLALIVIEPPGPVWEWLVSRVGVGVNLVSPVLELLALCVHATHLYLRHVAVEVRSANALSVFVLMCCTNTCVLSLFALL
jgi:hypothetical protein